MSDDRLPTVCKCGGNTRPYSNHDFLIGGIRTTVNTVQCERCKRLYSLDRSRKEVRP